MTLTLRDALQHAAQRGLERLDAQLLLMHALGKPVHDRAWLLAHDSDPLPPDAQARYETLCHRREAGEPLAYLTGERSFYGLNLQVDAHVLVPRPDTETLVDWALEVMQDMPTHPPPTVLDLGTGSGAIALAIQHQRPDARVWAVDASIDALTVATANAQRLGLPVRCLHNHWLRHWPSQQNSHADTLPVPSRFDLIVSNPPYIRSSDPHLPALQHEPRQALVSGSDGLDDLREIVAAAPEHLVPDGWLLMEHGWDQAGDVAALLEAAGYRSIAHRLDLGGHTRCTGGQRGPNPQPLQAQPLHGFSSNARVG